MRFLKNFILSLAFLFLTASGARADFGNWFTANKRIPILLNSSSQKISFRFTCQDDMDLSAAAVYCVDAIDSPAYSVSLQEDRGGIPSGQDLVFASYVPRAQGWATLPLDSTPLLRGKVYHLVLEQDTKRGGGHDVGLIGPANFASFLCTDVLNHLHPNDGSPDPEANTLFFDGTQWKELNREPVYVLYGEHSRFQGNPYDDPGVRPIFGTGDPNDKTHQTLQGQSLHFHCGFQATQLAVRVRKEGNPTVPLNYQILKHEYQIHKAYPIHTAVLLTPDQASSNFKWVTLGFDDARTSNFSMECWFFAFQTDSGKPSPQAPGCEDCYVISDVGNSGGLAQASDLSFDGGAHLSREIFSTDGGSPFDWMDAFERDANVGVLGPDCHILPAKGAESFNTIIPTPMPWGTGEGSPP